MDDFNIRYYTEADFVDSPIVNDPLKLFIQELDVLFSTDEYTVLGNEDVGLSLERYLGKFSLSGDTIKALVIKKIKANCYMHEYFTWDVVISFKAALITDIMMVDVFIKNQFGTADLKRLSFIYR